jgi:DNA-binding transcriptional MerR regulator
MKKYYKINEISKLYGIGKDSIRYYEKLGILKPRRDENDYRRYSLKEMYKLNMIRDLRSLDFTMEQIKEYLENQCVRNTLEMLNQEKKYLQKEQKILKAREKRIQERIIDISQSLEVETDKVTIKEIKDRYCVQLNEHITRDEEIDFLMKKLEQKHEEKIRDFGNQIIGAFYDMEDIISGSGSIYESIFFELDKKTKDYDFFLPAGKYLSYYYRGTYDQNQECCKRVLKYAKDNKVKHDGKLFEFYHIDNRDTIDEREFLTEVQLRLT